VTWKMRFILPVVVPTELPDLNVDATGSFQNYEAKSPSLESGRQPPAS
jgi:hypothetical protein